MTALYNLSVILWQTDPGLPSRDEHWLMVCIAVIAFSMAIQAIVTLVVGMGSLKMIKEFKGLAQDIHGKALPIMQRTNDVIEDLSPKIRTVSENVTQISYTVREKLDEVGETVTQINRTVAETNHKTRAQVDHVDRMMNSALETTEDVANTVAHGIRVPLRQVAGMIAGLRVGIDTLVKNFAPKNGRGPGADF